MATKKRLIDGNKAQAVLVNMAEHLMEAGNPELAGAVGYAAELIGKQKTVDAVEVADMREFAEDVAYQFGYYCQKGGRLHITNGGLSTLEWAFNILRWENPHPVPECECEIEGCHEHATCGTPTADGYKRMCGKHLQKHCEKMDGYGNG